jgi:hypothetical protein
VSQNSGTWLQWASDGREIFFQEESGDLKVVSVDGGGETFTIGRTEDVMPLGGASLSGIMFSVAPDAQRILAGTLSNEFQEDSLDLLVGWRPDQGE